MAGPLQLTSLDFANHRDELKAYLATKPEFTDVNFEGSNLSFLVEALAYVSNYFGYVANATFNETNLLTAAQRKNLVINAHDLSYDIDRAIPATATIRVVLTDMTQVLSKDPSFSFTLDTLVLPRFSTIISNDGTRFLTEQDYVFSPDNNYTLEFPIRQGSIVQDFSLGTSNASINQRFRLEEPNLADILTELRVNGVVWDNEQDITLYGPTSQNYQIQENFREVYDFIFGDGQLGEIPVDNADITLTYMISDGSLGNDKTGFVLLGSTYINGNIDPSNEIDNTAYTTTTLVRSIGGRNKEAIESIRRNAPQWYQSQGRAISESDYSVLLRRHQFVEFVNVYGGETLRPPQAGFVYATIKPPGADALTTEQMDDIIAYMEPFHIKGIRFRIQAPTFINVELNVRVNYDLRITSQTTILSRVRTTTQQYFLDASERSEGFLFSNMLCDIDMIEGIINSRMSNKFYLNIVSSVDNVYYYNLGQELIPASLSLLFNNDTQGWSDDPNMIDDDNAGAIVDIENGSQIGTVNYLTGIISIGDYEKITGEEKLYFDTASGDAELYQNVLVRYDEGASIFTANGVTRG